MSAFHGPSVCQDTAACCILCKKPAVHASEFSWSVWFFPFGQEAPYSCIKRQGLMDGSEVAREANMRAPLCQYKRKLHALGISINGTFPATGSSPKVAFILLFAPLHPVCRAAY